MWAPQMKHTDVDKKWWGAVRYYSTNEDDKMPPAGRYNAGQKISLLGIFLGRRGAACQWSRAVVSGIHSVESPLLALHFRSHSPAAALFTIWAVLIHIYMGVVCRARRAQLSNPWRCFDRLCQALPSRLYKEIVGDSSSPRK